MISICCYSRILRSSISPSSLLFSKPPNPHPRHFSTRFARSISSTPPPPPQPPPPTSPVPPPTPLFLRPPIHSTALSDLKKWRNWAKHLALSVGTKFSELDDGPDADLLCRELKWLLEDVIDDKSLVSAMDSAENLGFVNLRADLEELYMLWKQRIEERRPFQYLVGCEHWRDMVLCVEEGVLIPRPETEKIVDMVEDVVLMEEGMREGLWVDLGTGSGALAVAIGRILGDGGGVIGTDLSPIAASVAAFNVQRYGLQDKVEIRQGSWFEPLDDVNGILVGIVSNPPYIPRHQIFGLQAEVARHEPRLALDGGEKGMDAVLHICEGAAMILKPGGFFALETNGEKQSEFLLDFMTHKMKGRFQNVRVESDFAGIPRFITGFRC